MVIKVAHIVAGLKGTSIPLEIANKLNDVPGIRSDIISLSGGYPPPDIVDIDNIVLNKDIGAKEICKFLRANKYDLVNTHAFTVKSTIISLRLMSSDIVHVNSQHGRIHYSTMSKLANSITLATCDALIYNSYTTLNSYTKIESLFIRKKPQKVIHLGINLKTLDKYTKKVKGEVKRISIAARLIPRKNHATLLKAVKHLDDENIHLDIIGGGPLHEKLVAETRRLGVEDRVTFHGQLKNRGEVYGIMSNSNLFVLPSYGEGFCLAVVEAMALGLPVIVSDLDIFHEVVGDAGIFVPPNNALEIAKAIQALKNDPDRAREIGEKNKKRARSRFTLDRTVKKYKEFYDVVLKD